ncbi:MAG: cytochrome c, partial [Planctomycetes bacterium]|nr:cytochrome c [Planctomycetota bacterium]
MKLYPRDIPGVIAASVATVVGLALMVSGSSVTPAEGPALSARTRALSLGEMTEELFVASLEHTFGTHEDPKLPESWEAAFIDAHINTLTAARLAAGRRSYTLNCQHCHGVRGDAETQTAKILLPRPRDFSLGFTKFKQTPGTSAPLREDLHRILEVGVASTAMADFAHLDKSERIELTDYVQYLLMRGAVETRVAGAIQALANADGKRI